MDAARLGRCGAPPPLDLGAVVRTLESVRASRSFIFTDDRTPQRIQWMLLDLGAVVRSIYRGTSLIRNSPPPLRPP